MRKLSTKELRLLFGQDEYAIKCDKWDIEDFQDIKECSSDLLQQEVAGNKILPTFSNLMQDVFDAIYKAHPKLHEEWQMKKELLLNHAVMEQVNEHRRIKEIRTLSCLDTMASAVGVSTFSEELMEILEQEKEKLENFQDFLDAAQKYQEAVEAASEEEDEEGEEVEGQGIGSGDEEGDEDAPEGSPGSPKPSLTLAQAKKRLEESHQKFKEGFNTPEFKAKLGKAFGRVKHKVVETNNMLSTWGLGGDNNFQQMDYRQKMDLMDKLRSNSKLKKIAELAGRMTTLAMSQQNQKVRRGSEEVYDVEMGRDLSRLLPTELMKLQDPLREEEFLRNLFEGTCLQYALKGKEKKARGPIVCCIDESGSMGGESEIWAKAVALALYHVATRQKRSFFVIHFDGNRDPKRLPVHAFPKNEPPNMIKMIEMAEHFLCGGTDFETPLTRARMCIEEDGEYHKADIIFITDGECAVRDVWLKDFNKWRKEKGINVFSVLIDAGYNADATLKEFSTSVAKLSDMTADSDDIVLDIFARV